MGVTRHMINLQLLGDIDIDTPDRSKLLAGVWHVPASATKKGHAQKHNTGVYFHTVPCDPFTQLCSLPYDQAEQKGYYKIDLLNNHLYQGVRDEAHLNLLMQTPPMWEMLQHEEFVQQLAHVNQHFTLLSQLKPQSIPQLAMVLALIRPGKRHLVRKCVDQGWSSIEPELWQPDHTGYAFKKSHSISLSVSIVVQMNLLVEQLS